jgi:hypothetical protein
MNITKKICLEYYKLNNPNCEYIYENIETSKFYENIIDKNYEYIAYKVINILKSPYYKDIEIIKLLYNSVIFIDHSIGAKASRAYIFSIFLNDREYRINIIDDKISCVSVYKHVNKMVVEIIYHYLEDDELLL